MVPIASHKFVGVPDGLDPAWKDCFGQAKVSSMPAMSDALWLFLLCNEFVPVKETSWKVDGLSIPDDPLLVEDKGVSFGQFVSKYEINLDLHATVFLSYLNRPYLGYVLAYKGPPTPRQSDTNGLGNPPMVSKGFYGKCTV
jgi:hypothetical protein